jgi:protein PhnA
MFSGWFLLRVPTYPTGTPLAEGGKVTLLKGPKVKSSSLVLKIGTKAVITRLK